MSNSFKADVIQIGNLTRALTENAAGDLVFRDASVPGGVRLQDVGLGSVLISVSGSLQAEIDSNYATLVSVSGTLGTNIDNNYSTLVSASGTLQDEISYSNTLKEDIFTLPGLIIPSYIYPTSAYSNSDYNNLIDLKKKYHNVPLYTVLNPSSGPGSVVDGNYSVTIDRLHGANSYVFGYVPTAYAISGSSYVETFIDGWKSLYPTIDGIFFDEVSDEDGYITFYQNLSTYARSKGFQLTIGNTGAIVSGTYLNSDPFDLTIIYEISGYPAEATLKGDFAEGNFSYNYKNRGAIAYNVAFDKTSAYMMKKYVGALYITDDNIPNPWNSFPSYLEDLFKTLSIDETVENDLTGLKSISGDFQAQLDALGTMSLQDAGNVNITGGTITSCSVAATNLVVTDPLIQVAPNNTGDTVDFGMYGEYQAGPTYYAGVFRDASDSGRFKFFYNVSDKPTTTVQTSGFANLGYLDVKGLRVYNNTFSSKFIELTPSIFLGSEDGGFTFNLYPDFNLVLNTQGTGKTTANIVDIAGGTGSEIDETVIGANVAAAGTFTDLIASNATVNNSVSVVGNLTVNGTFTAAGSAFFVDQEHVRTTDNMITLNYGEVGPGVTSITSGIEIDRGTLEKYYFLFDELRDDSFRIGTSGDLQAVATREDSPIDRAIAYWNDSNNSFLTSSNATLDTITGNTANIASNYSTLVAASGILRGNIDTNYATLVATSGNLYSTIANSSGALQAQLTYLEGISADWARKSLENTFTAANTFNGAVTIANNLVVTGTVNVSGAINISPDETLISVAVETPSATGDNVTGQFTDKGIYLTYSVDGFINSFISPVSAFNAAGYNTNATTPYTISAKSTDGYGGGATYAAWKTFDGATNTEWLSEAGNAFPQWLKIDCGSGKVIAKYKFKNQYEYDTASPTAWQFQGSNDDSDWTTLDSQTGVALVAGEVSSQYSIASPASYQYYRMNITAKGASNYTGIAEMYLYEGSVATTLNTVDTIELVSSGTKNFTPSTLVIKDQAAATISGAGKVNVSYSKNGAAFTTLEDMVTFQARSATDLAGCTSLKIRIQPVGAQKVSSVYISTPSSSISLKNDGTITNSVNNIPTFTVSSAGAVVATGTIVADSCYGRAVQITQTDSPYFLDTNYTTVRVDASGGNVMVVVPTAVGVEGRRYSFIAVTEPGANTITLSGSLSQTFNGAASYTSLDDQWDHATIESTNANWIVIG